MDGLPLSLRGTAFQCSVWQQLMEIPYGSTLSYGAVAAAVSCGSARAVGVAIGRNPLAIVIPCHRVVAADGKLIGYAGGLEQKIWLLRHEGVLLDKYGVSRQQ